MVLTQVSAPPLCSLRRSPKERCITVSATLSRLYLGWYDLSTPIHHFLDEDLCRSLATAFSTVTLLSSDQHDFLPEFANEFLAKNRLWLLLHYLAQLPQECMDARVGKWVGGAWMTVQFPLLIQNAEQNTSLLLSHAKDVIQLLELVLRQVKPVGQCDDRVVLLFYAQALIAELLMNWSVLGESFSSALLQHEILYTFLFEV